MCRNEKNKQMRYHDSNSHRGFRNPSWIERHWFNLILLYVTGHFAFHSGLDLQINFGSIASPAVAETQQFGLASIGAVKPAAIPAANVSQFKKINRAADEAEKATKKAVAVPGFSMRNLTPILNPSYAKRKGIPSYVAEEKLKVCRDYVQAFQKTAQEEMNRYGIPASITLAQGLLESDAGESTLARESYNHFGIKCRSRCIGCTCRNYADDVAYDMFRVFEDASESFREHSLLLSSGRYAHLKKLPVSDYKGWAHGLKKAGYATDKTYAEKLIQIIEVLHLTQYDVKA